MNNLNDNFWKWFGDSKVVDDNGNPLIVYHGSPKNDIEIFDVSRGLNINGIYFSDNLSVAAHWSGNSEVKRKKNIPNVDTIEELLQILNIYTEATIEYVDFDDGRFYRLETYGGDVSSPLGYKKNDNTYILRGKEYDLRDRLKEEINSFSDYSENSGNYGCYLSIQNPMVVDANKKPYYRIDFNGDIVNTEQLAIYAQENGYDGVIIKNLYETDYENILCNDYIVFNSNQIKSIDNNGNWSKNSNNIYENKNANILNITKGIKHILSESNDFDNNFIPELNDNFWKWFGDSITIDDNGEPIVFYHGTRSDFVEFKSEYDDNLIFFAFDKKFADEWGRNKSYSSDIKDTIYNRAKPYRNNLYKSYQSKYGDDFYYNNEEAYKLYKDEINNYENELEKEYNVHSRTIPCYLKIHKIFMPEKHYELVLDEIMDYYGFPKEAIDHKKEIEELRKEKEILISNFKSSGRKLPTKEEEDELNTINDKISILYDEQNSLRDFETNHLKRIKKGAWIYFEHGIVIDKIWSLGFDAIQLSESNGEQTTMAVRANNNQIKAVNNNGNWSNSNNIYETRERIDNIEYLYNPIKSELQGLLNKSSDEVRGILVTETDEVYVWDAHNYTHHHMEGLFGLSSSVFDNSIIEFRVHDGHIYSNRPFGDFFDFQISMIKKSRLNNLGLEIYQLKNESFKKEHKMSTKQLIEKLKQVIINSKEEDFWDEMEDETGMNKVAENVVSMFDYKYKQEDLMEKFIRKYLKNDDYYTLYKVAKMLSSMNKLYLEKNLDVKLSDKEYNELKDDLKDLVRLGDEALNEEVSSAQLGSAPTPSLGQVTVNGKPWTSGKSYKAKRKKKQVKESILFKLKNIIKMVEQQEFGTIPQKIGEWLDRLKFKNIYTRNNIVYEKEGNYRHIISYNNQEDMLKYLILNNGDVVFNDSWYIKDTNDVNTIFSKIVKEYEGHE